MDFYQSIIFMIFIHNTIFSIDQFSKGGIVLVGNNSAGERKIPKPLSRIDNLFYESISTSRRILRDECSDFLEVVKGKQCPSYTNHLLRRSMASSCETVSPRAAASRL